jgi:diacylglycerol kinase (ATP)
MESDRYWHKRMTAVLHAIRGVGFCIGNEAHFRLELLMAALVVLGGCWLGLSQTEWLAVSGCIALVLALEAVNTAIEQVCNTVSKDIHAGIKAAKDTAAAAVLLAVLGSAVVGGVIFLPKIIGLF